MYRSFVLLQLTIWITCIHAFYPYVPTWLCQEDGTCESVSKRLVEDGLSPRDGDDAPPGFVTFALNKVASKREESHSERIARIARDLRLKYGAREPSPTVVEDSKLAARANHYSVVTASTPAQTNSAGVNQDGTDFSYFISVAVGSSATSMYMLLDTGASTTWVMGSSCASNPCTMHNTFSTQSSTSYKDTGKTFSVQYGSGSVSGQVISDTLTVAGMKVSIPFGLANVTSDDFAQFPFDGILGLSMSTGATQNFLKTLQTSKAISSNLFAVALSRNGDGINDGEVTFGATDTAKFTGSISYTSVSSDAGGAWAIPIDDITASGSSAGLKGKIAYIDTGTTYIFGPPTDVAALYKLIPGSKSADSGTTWTVPCDTTAQVAFTFSGKSYNVSAKDFLSSPGSDGRCTCNVYGIEVVAGEWLLGDTFLKNVYAVFDADHTQIGFAPRATASSSGTASASATKTSGSSQPASTGATSGTVTTDTASSAAGGPTMGLGGHETPSNTASAAAETASPTATPTPASAGDHLEIRGLYTLIACMLTILAMVA